MNEKVNEPLPLDKEQIPSKGTPDPLPLREEQIPDAPARERLAYSALPATTTVEEQTVTAGQRRISGIWEGMQAYIAALVVTFGVYVAVRLALLYLIRDATEAQQTIAYAAFVVLYGLVNNVIGFYFGRTNHQRVGGVGVTKEQAEQGR